MSLQEEVDGETVILSENYPAPRCERADTCLKPEEHEEELGICAEFVNYPFCLRSMQQGEAKVAPFTTVKERASDVNACMQGTFWDSEDNADCYAAATATACYMAFPKCHIAGQPEGETSLSMKVTNVEPKTVAYGVCSSSCIKERVMCRVLGSQFGPYEFIETMCSAPPFVAEGECTGGASRQSVCGVTFFLAFLFFALTEAHVT